MNRVEALLEQGRAEGVYSHARAVVRHRGAVVFDGGPAAADALFDLASVTKVMATTALLCRLAAKQAIDLDAPVRSLLPGAATAATLTELALHRSGLPPFRPFFAEVAATLPTVFENPTPALLAAAREQTVSRVLAVEPERPIGAAAVYSDLGFILLGEALSISAGLPLDELFVREIAEPLRLRARFRRVSTAPEAAEVISTGGTRPREPAPGQEGLWQCGAWPSRAGEVDDDNAWVMNGVAGHAGLFATAADVASFGQAVLDGVVIAPRGWGVDVSTPGSTRAFGFDTPSAEQASCGQRFGRAGPRGAIGHLGFTGTSLWIDFDRQLVVALLTNRVVFGRSNVQIRSFRPRFHDAVLDALER